MTLLLEGKNTNVNHTLKYSVIHASSKISWLNGGNHLRHAQTVTGDIAYYVMLFGCDLNNYGTGQKVH